MQTKHQTIWKQYKFYLSVLKTKKRKRIGQENNHLFHKTTVDYLEYFSNKNPKKFLNKNMDLSQDEMNNAITNMSKQCKHYLKKCSYHSFKHR